MKLDESPRSDNVEDERGSGIGRGAGIGIGTIVIVVIGYFLGISPSTLLSLLNGDSQSVTAPAAQAPAPINPNDSQVDFVRAILGDTEAVWGAYFQNMGKVYTRPKLVLFSGQVDSACGLASSAAGPFYCPGDQKVYIDLSFYRQLATEFGAPGRFRACLRHRPRGGASRAKSPGYHGECRAVGAPRGTQRRQPSVGAR